MSNRNICHTLMTLIISARRLHALRMTTRALNTFQVSSILLWSPSLFATSTVNCQLDSGLWTAAKIHGAAKACDICRSTDERCDEPHSLSHVQVCRPSVAPGWPVGGKSVSRQCTHHHHASASGTHSVPVWNAYARKR